jgi:hypothetical protein
MRPAIRSNTRANSPISSLRVCQVVLPGNESAQSRQPARQRFRSAGLVGIAGVRQLERTQLLERTTLADGIQQNEVRYQDEPGKR